MTTSGWSGALGLSIAAAGLGGLSWLSDPGRAPIRAVAGEGASELAGLAVAEVARARGAEGDYVVRRSDDARAVGEVCRGEAEVALVGSAAALDCGALGPRLRAAPVAMQSAAIAVPVGNDFVDALSLEQLARVFDPEREAPTFAELDSRWPDVEVHAFVVDAEADLHRLVARRLGMQRLGGFEALATSAEVAAAIERDPDAIGFVGATREGVLSRAIRLVPVRAAGGEATYPTRDALAAGAYPLAATLSLVAAASGAATSKDAPTADFARDLGASIRAVAGGADCLAVANPPASVARR